MNHARISLKPYNTFGIDVRCSVFCQPATEEELKAAAESIAGQPFFVLGGGSNVLFTSDVEQCVIHPAMNFIRKIDETSDSVKIEAGAGTVWDNFVQYCVDNGYYGVENLSHIPGSAGAAPVQNIGAYGAEARQTLYSVRYFDMQELTFKTIEAKDCRFAYRTSIFKQSLSGRAVVTAVTFLLRQNAELQTHYGSLNRELAEMGGAADLQKVRQAVINVRRSKLPDPAVLGNAGSFFTNPVVSERQAAAMQAKYPEMPAHKSEGGIKLSAAWLIEQCGWRGRRRGNAGVYPQHALAIVNYGGATGSEILALAQDIAADVHRRFGVTLQTEVVTAGGQRTNAAKN